MLEALSSRRTCCTSCGPGFPRTHLAMELLLVYPPNPKCEMPGNIVQSTRWERLILVIIWTLQTSEALSMAELYSEDAVTHGLHVCLPGWGSVSAGKCANAGYLRWPLGTRICSLRLANSQRRKLSLVSLCISHSS